MKLFALFYLGRRRRCRLSRSCSGFSRETDADAMKKKRRRIEELCPEAEIVLSRPSVRPSVRVRPSAEIPPLILLLILFFPSLSLSLSLSLSPSPSFSGSSSILNPQSHSLVFAAVFNRDQEVLAPVLLVSREEE